jgi:hypothetical protein
MLQPDNSFVTVCAIASLFMHKPRQALRAQNYRLSQCSVDAQSAPKEEKYTK